MGKNKTILDDAIWWAIQLTMLSFLIGISGIMLGLAYHSLFGEFPC